ncbi:hypothetical protein [Streptomyces sp. ISL-11]|uniref:hypothetical protein n=1 Tax=Streptomyces sp. ISL-11 TaxID=2819174 RepID=UPI001BE8B884|nr:hypothetical protein [Streptomyces sp. ISL-11]MBT2385345.1 hypothetical protein [Streptomyces sp. ISL-11]
MHDLIRRWFAWVRAYFAPGVPEEGPRPRANDPAPSPNRAPAPTPPPHPTPTCAVHLWATAHGIDLKPSSPLRTCTCAAPEPPPLPAPGTFVLDERTGQVGEVMAHDGPHLQLRPPSGGREWDVQPGTARPATPAELLSAKVRAVNGAGRWGK